MGRMPQRVREAYERGDHEAIRRMRIAAAQTRAKNRLLRLEKEKRRRDEEEALQDWYDERFEEEMSQTDPSIQRQDHLLSDEDLPF